MTFPKSPKGADDDAGRLLRWPLPPPPAPPSGFWGHLRRLGPGMVTGTANVDPSLVVTATVVGATFGYSLLWVVVLCLPFLLAVFQASGRLGFETRKGLVDLLREHYGRGAALACALVVAVINMAMIIADLLAVSDALSIILNQRRVFFAAAVAFSVWYILIFRDYRKITSVLLWFSLPLYVYVASAIIVAPSPGTVLLGTIIPHVQPSSAYAGSIVALFGSLLTPYILVWQTSSRGEHAASGGERPHSFESHAGSVVSVLLSYCVMVSAAAVLHLSAPIDMTTRQAAEALRPAVGALGPILFAVGIIGAGMVALPVLCASLCYSVSEAMGWKSGLSEHPWDAPPFYVLISLSMFSAAVANFFRINPVKALYLSQLLAGVLTIPILIFILLLANDRRVVKTANTVSQNFWVGAAVGALLASGLLWLWWAIR
ncbi:MAG: divalent metal cation transporter [Candidatus Korobacteraceae bacterium]